MPDYIKLYYVEVTYLAHIITERLKCSGCIKKDCGDISMKEIEDVIKEYVCDVASSEAKHINLSWDLADPRWTLVKHKDGRCFFKKNWIIKYYWKKFVNFLTRRKLR